MERTIGKRSRFFAAALSLAALVAASSVFPSDSQPRATSVTPFRQYIGPGGCSSTSCHGSIAPRTDTPILQNEYSTWIVRDKHSSAYAALTGMVGERMAAILGLGRAETAHQCLACHALDVPASDRARTFELSDGVSCENCHGSASAWLGPHTERSWTHQQSVALGMYDARDLVLRTENCLSCHLGDGQKSVNHQMIAAGHPDLYFELDTFSAAMPRHWKESEEPGEPEGSDSWYDVREWAVGQAVELRQSLRLLASRAQGDVWPEYSELECYACHHALGSAEQSWRQARGYPNRRAGNPPWNDSSYVLFRELVRQVDEPTAKSLDADMAQLAGLMDNLNPDREAVKSDALAAAQLADTLAAKLNAMPYDSAWTARLIRQICANADSIASQDEHAAAQAAMALEALFTAYDRNEKTQNAQEARAAINDLFDQLRVPSNYDPAQFSRRMREAGSLLR